MARHRFELPGSPLSAVDPGKKKKNISSPAISLVRAPNSVSQAFI